MSTTKKTTERTTTVEGGNGAAFSAEERAAMKERSREVKAQRGAGADPAADVLATIAELPEPDRTIAERVHAIVREVAPGLEPRTWYGMPAYALPGKGRKAGKIVCFLQPAAKFSTRYASLGFNDDAQLDDGRMWPTAFAVTEVSEDVEKQIRDLVARAAGTGDG